MLVDGMGRLGERTAFPRAPACSAAQQKVTDFRTLAGRAGANFEVRRAAQAPARRARERSAFPEASHPVGEHAAGACALPAASPGGPRSSAPTWPPLPRRLERLNRPARPRCHSTLRSDVGAAGQPGLILRAQRTGWSSSSTAAPILDALKLPGSSASLQSSRRSRGARSSPAGGRVMLLFGATRRVGVTMYL